MSQTRSRGNVSYLGWCRRYKAHVLAPISRYVQYMGHFARKYSMFVYHNSTKSLNARIFKNRVYNISSTFECSNSSQNICHLRAFDSRFTHSWSMTDTSMKKLEFQQLTLFSKLTNKTNMGRFLMTLHGRGMVGF